MSPARDRLAAEVAAYDRQAAVVADVASGFDDDAWAAPSALPGWDVRTLVAHVAASKQGLAEYLTRPGTGKPLAPAAYVRAYASDADGITAASQTFGRTHTPAELVAALRAATPVPGLADAAVVAGPRGPFKAIDLVRTRVVDLVVHVDDLARTFPDAPAPELVRPALATAVRTLAEILAGQAPGRSVEVRVPPFAAVQAVPGPRHTRGTPPNVVETDAVTWLRLATGRQAFLDAAASGAVRATGARGDLTEFLPVLA